jgi:hypothetical protein
MPWRSVERRKHYCQNGVVRPLRLDHPTVGITCMQATRWLRRDNASDAALHAWPLAKLHLPTNWPHCWPIRSLMRNLRMAAHSMTGHLTMLYGRSRMVVGKFRAVDARKWLGRRVLTLRGFTDSTMLHMAGCGLEDRPDQPRRPGLRAARSNVFVVPKPTDKKPAE